MKWLRQKEKLKIWNLLSFDDVSLTLWFHQKVTNNFLQKQVFKYKFEILSSNSLEFKYKLKEYNY